MYEADDDKHTKNKAAKPHVKGPRLFVIYNRYVSPSVNGSNATKKQQHIIQKFIPRPSV